MWPFRRKKESAEEIATEERLGEAAREEAHRYLRNQEELRGFRPQDAERRDEQGLGTRPDADEKN